MEAWDHCNYMGWWFKTAQLFVDLTIKTRECRIGTHAAIIDGAGLGCYSVDYEIKKAVNIKVAPFHKKEEGMYGWGINSCKDAAAFDRHENEERSFLDALRNSASEIQDDASNLDDVEFEEADEDYYDNYY